MPTELQALYGRKTFSQRVRHVLPYVLPALSLAVIAAAIVFGALWLRNHQNKPTVATEQHNSTSSPNRSTGNAPAPPASPSPAPTPEPNPAPEPAPPAAPPATPGASTPTTSDLTNAGPGDVVLIVAATAIGAVAASYARQLRDARQLR